MSVDIALVSMPAAPDLTHRAAANQIDQRQQDNRAEQRYEHAIQRDDLIDRAA